VAQERHALRSEACQQYWDHQLQNLTMTRLPHHTASPPTPDAVSSADLEMPVLSEVFTGLQNLARHAAVPLKSVLLAAHLQVLGWLSKQPEVLTGLMTHGRPEEPDAERVLGLFLNVLPLRLRLPTGSWQALVQATFQAEQELLPFRHYPIAHLPESRHRLPVFETVFNFIHFHVYQGLRELPGFEYITGKFFDPFPYTLKANFVVNPLSSQLLLSLNYNQSKLHQEHIQTIGQYYTNALTALAMGSPREFHL
jgi:microcystin synthetase protein McyA